MGKFQVVAHDGQARSDATDVAFHRLDGGREAGELGLVLVLDARPLVGEADGVAPVEDGYDDLDESRMDEILRNLADDGVGDGPALRFRLFVDGGRERLDVVGGRRRHDLGYARGAAQIVVERDARDGRDVGVIESTLLRGFFRRFFR